MILERLKEYSERLELPPPSYKKMPVNVIVHLNKQSEATGIEHPEPDEKGKAKSRWIPNPGKRSGTKPQPALITDNSDYVLGVYRPDQSDDPQIRWKHQAYRELVHECANKTSLESLRVIDNFLSKRSWPSDRRFADITSNDTLTFEVEGIHPPDLREVRDFWVDKTEGEQSGFCLLCGEKRKLTRRHPVPLKGIPQKKMQDVQLISANKNPFYSYGLEESYIAPMCRKCSEAVHHTINHLIASEQNSFRIGQKIVYLFWAREEIPFSINNLFSDPTEDDVKRLFSTPFKGKAGIDFEVDHFYALALSGSGGRAVVQDWIETTLPKAQQNLINYFNRMYIIGKYAYHSLYRLAGGTVHELKDLPTWIPVALFRHALNGQPLPYSILTTTLKRCSIGYTSGDRRQHVYQAQAALIKLFLISNHVKRSEIYKEDWMTSLDPNFERPAYRYGRLFNVLERIQENATGGGGVERTFGSAMTSPVSTLPRLIGRAKQAHLPKLKRDKPGLYYWFQETLTEILEKPEPLGGFKTRLEPEEQGLFVLGYYHQRAHRKSDEEAKTEMTETSINNSNSKE